MESIKALNRRVGAVELRVGEALTLAAHAADRVGTLECRLEHFTGQEFPHFKSTVFLMMEDLTGALETLSGMSLKFREELKKHKTRH